MPPKSSTKEATPSSRRSTRLAPTSVPAEEKQSNGKKVIPTHSCTDGTDKQRSAEDEKESSKKVKVDNSSKDNTASKAKSKKESNVEVEIKQSKAPKAEKEKEKVKPKPKSSSNSKLQKGHNLPSIKLENEDGEEVDVSTLTEGGKGVVIFVYPKVSSIFHNEIFELKYPSLYDANPHLIPFLHWNQFTPRLSRNTWRTPVLSLSMIVHTLWPTPDSPLYLVPINMIASVIRQTLQAVPTKLVVSETICLKSKNWDTIFTD